MGGDVYTRMYRIKVTICSPRCSEGLQIHYNASYVDFAWPAVALFCRVIRYTETCSCYSVLSHKSNCCPLHIRAYMNVLSAPQLIGTMTYSAPKLPSQSVCAVRHAVPNYSGTREKENDTKIPRGRNATGTFLSFILSLFSPCDQKFSRASLLVSSWHRGSLAPAGRPRRLYHGYETGDRDSGDKRSKSNLQTGRRADGQIERERERERERESLK